VAQILLDSVTKVYGGDVVAVDGVSLEIGTGEFLVLVGPSGCGKSTLLRMIAGLEEVTEGTIAIDERDVTDLPPRSRDVAMVFQTYALYPHMTVRENLGYGLRVRKTPKHEIGRRVEEVAQMLGLEELLGRRPAALSGGQRQRVAMGRAIVREPSAFLMDEPLSNLDAKLRVQMRAEVSRLQRDLGTTTIYVTHDQVEAMTMGDRVAVMRKGELQQVADPQTLYDRPVNLFVGGFIGSPAMNMLEATVTRANGGLAVDVGEQQLALDEAAVAARPGLRAYEGKKVIVGIRPEDLDEASLEPDTPADRRLRGVVELREALGSELMVHFTVEGTRAAMTEDVKELARDVGETTTAETQEGQAPLVGRFGARAPVEERKPVEIAVDTRSLHFFDIETSRGIYDGEPNEKGAQRDAE